MMDSLLLNVAPHVRALSLLAIAALLVLRLLWSRSKRNFDEELLSELSPLLHDSSSSEYDWANVRVCATTWNVGAMAPSESFDASAILVDHSDCDLLVIALQEIVELSATNVLLTGSETTSRAKTDSNS
jgi:hypothetical protein